MRKFIHPAKEDITLAGILDALGDPLRLKILKFLMTCGDGDKCRQCESCPEISRSTLSNHFRILREAGLIRMEKNGVETNSELRLAEIEELYPGLLEQIMKHVP